jgi:hypothetical protein
LTIQQLPQLQALHLKINAMYESQQLVLLAAWLKQHGHIVSTLKIYDTGTSAPAWAELVAAFQVAAVAAAASPTGDAAAEVSTKQWQLQTFTTGIPDAVAASTELLQHLPAHSLTQLKCFFFSSLDGAAQIHVSP